MTVPATWDRNCTQDIATAFSNGDRDFTPGGSGRIALATIGTLTVAKCYWEQTQVAGGPNTYNEWGLGYATCSPFSATDRWVYRNNYIWHNGSLSGGPYGTLSGGDTIGVAVEDTGSGVRVWIRRPDGAWATGDPAAGTSPLLTLSSAVEWFPLCRGEYLHTMRINAGQEAYVFTPPAGFADLAIPDIEQYEDLALDLAYIHDHAEDLRAPLQLAEMVLEDVPLDLRAASLLLGEDLPLVANLCGRQLRDVPLALHLDDGVVTADLAADLRLTDGTAYGDLALRVRLARTAPLYQAVIAQRLRSVKHV